MLIVCWLPFHVGRIIYINTEDSRMMHFSQYFNIVALQLFYLSASINPILYNLISKKYRAAAWKLLLGQRPRQRDFYRSGGIEGDPGGGTASYTGNSNNRQTAGKQVSCSHTSGTRENSPCAVPAICREIKPEGGEDCYCEKGLEEWPTFCELVGTLAARCLFLKPGMKYNCAHASSFPFLFGLRNVHFSLMNAECALGRFCQPSFS